MRSRRGAESPTSSGFTSIMPPSGATGALSMVLAHCHCQDVHRILAQSLLERYKVVGLPRYAQLDQAWIPDPLGPQPRPTKGILVAMIVINRTLVSNGRAA